MAAAYVDYLFQESSSGNVQPLVGVWVQLSSSTLGTFTSSSATSTVGLVSFDTAPSPGIYEVYTGGSATGPWTDTGLQYQASGVVDESGLVSLTGTQTITGSKTFTATANLTAGASITNASVNGLTLTGTNSIQTGLVIDGTLNSAASGNPIQTKGTGSSAYSTFTRFFYGDNILCGLDRYRKTRGTHSSPTAVQDGDHVSFFDWAAYDGANVASPQPDGIGYGGGVGEMHVDIDQTPPQAGSGHTPGRFVLGITPKFGDPTGSTTIPAVDPAPVDNFQITSWGDHQIGVKSRLGVNPPQGTILTVNGDVYVEPMISPAQAPIVTAVGNVSSTNTYTYMIVPVGPGNIDGVPSPPSNTVSNDFSYATGTTLAWTGRSTTATKYNSIAPYGGESMPGAIGYRLLVSENGGAYQYLYTYQIGSLAHIDDGSVVPQAYTAATANPGGRVIAARTLVNGTYAGTPTVVVNANAGTGATATMGQYATDVAGLVTITTGSASWAGGPQCQVTFGIPYPVTPTVILTPGGTYAFTWQGYVGNPTTTGFEISLNVAPTASHPMYFYYYVIGNI